MSLQPLFSTAEMPAGRDFRAWRDVVSTRNLPVTGTPVTAVSLIDGPFAGAIRWAHSGGVIMVEHTADPVALERSQAQIAGSPLDACHLFLQLEGEWRFAQDGFEQLMRPGDLMLVDPNRPFRSVKHVRWRHRVMRVPRALGERAIGGGRRRFAALRGESGLGRAVSSYMLSLTEEVHRMSGEAARAGQAQLCQLLAAHRAVSDGTAIPETARSAVRSAKLAQVHRYIERHLARAELGPAEIARANGLSLRSLHLLFEPTGIGVAQYLTTRRIERCRDALSAQPEAAIAGIAFAQGFADLSTFQRAFKRRYGLTPSEVRLAPQAMASGASPAT